LKRKNEIILFILAIIILTSLVNYSTKTKAQENGYANNVQLIARAINGEARGEPYEGQVAVGAVL
jgi:N-acetylmuramoyl-L-alanine amidase